MGGVGDGIRRLADVFRYVYNPPNSEVPKQTASAACLFLIFLKYDKVRKAAQKLSKKTEECLAALRR